MELAIGDTVVYGAHGAGPITAREIRDVRGKEQVVIVVALADGLSIELPLARAEEMLRPLADAEEIARLGVVLRSEAALDLDPWLKRQRAARGDAVGVGDGRVRPGAGSRWRSGCRARLQAVS